MKVNVWDCGEVTSRSRNSEEKEYHFVELGVDIAVSEEAALGSGMVDPNAHAVARCVN